MDGPMTSEPRSSPVADRPDRRDRGPRCRTGSVLARTASGGDPEHRLARDRIGDA